MKKKMKLDFEAMSIIELIFIIIMLIALLALITYFNLWVYTMVLVRKFCWPRLTFWEFVGLEYLIKVALGNVKIGGDNK